MRTADGLVSRLCEQYWFHLLAPDFVLAPVQVFHVGG